jgi:hypothetical protein
MLEWQLLPLHRFLWIKDQSFVYGVMSMKDGRYIFQVYGETTPYMYPIRGFHVALLCGSRILILS